METAVQKAFRHSMLWLIGLLPAEPRRRIERRFRGWEEVGKLKDADIVVISYGKSGRTWLRVMLSRFYQVAFGLDREEMLGFDNLHRREPRVPRIFFTHDNFLKDYTGHSDSKIDYQGKRIVLLVRNPKDVAVSLFFQWKHRMRPNKKILNRYPPDGSEILIYDFVMSDRWGLPRVIGFMNLWAEEVPKFDDLMVVRYEDMRADPEGALEKIMSFIGGPVRKEHIRDAVEYASVENMRKQEESNDSRFTSGRMKPGQKGVRNSYKVRRAKVGGYRDYFAAEEIEAIDALAGSTLSSTYRYGTESPQPSSAMLEPVTAG